MAFPPSVPKDCARQAQFAAYVSGQIASRGAILIQIKESWRRKAFLYLEYETTAKQPQGRKDSARGRGMRTYTCRSAERQAVRMHEMMRRLDVDPARSFACGGARFMPRRGRDAWPVTRLAIASAGLTATHWKAKAPISARTCRVSTPAGGGGAPPEGGRLFGRAYAAGFPEPALPDY